MKTSHFARFHACFVSDNERLISGPAYLYIYAAATASPRCNSKTKHIHNSVSVQGEVNQRPDFFISYYDLQQALLNSPDLLAKWPLMMPRLATILVITVAAICGRARGIGLEFVSACDIPFGSKEKAIHTIAG